MLLSVLNFTEIDLVCREVGGSLHTHELQETNDQEEEHQETEQNASQHVGIEVGSHDWVATSSCLSISGGCDLSKRNGAGLLEADNDWLVSRYQESAFASSDSHNIARDCANFLDGDLNLLWDLVENLVV